MSWDYVLRGQPLLGKRALAEVVVGRRPRALGKGLVRLVIVALVLAACSHEKGSPQQFTLEDVNHDGKIVIFAFGDSITRGVGDGPRPGDTPPGSAGYPLRLQTLLGVTIINDGHSGERTTEGLLRLQRDVKDTHPDYAILVEGTNDLLVGEDRHRAVDNMRSMIDAVRAAGAVPILGTIPPLCCDVESSRPQTATLAFYDEELRTLAANSGVGLIDFYSAFTGGREAAYDAGRGLLHAPEGIHPTSAGYDVMAEAARQKFLRH
jgi:lysophospholipase L1-like esterase